MDHRLQHLSRGDDRAARITGRPDDELLDERHFGRADLDAEVAAGDHDAVGGLDDLVEVLERLALLDLGYDPGPRPRRIDAIPQPRDIVGGADERQRDVVDTVLQGERQIGRVLLGQRRDRELDAREVHALPGRDQATDLDPGLDPGGVNVRHPRPHGPVGTVRAAAGGRVAGPPERGDRGAAGRRAGGGIETGPSLVRGPARFSAAARDGGAEIAVGIADLDVRRIVSVHADDGRSCIRCCRCRR